MLLRAVVLAAVAMAGVALGAGAWAADARKAEAKTPPVTAKELEGRWRYSPGEGWKGVALRADGTSTMYGGKRNTLNHDGQWGFDAHHQTVIFANKFTKRAYQVIREEGEIVLIKGRELWREGVDMNTPLDSPLDKMVRAPAELEKTSTGYGSKKSDGKK